MKYKMKHLLQQSFKVIRSQIKRQIENGINENSKIYELRIKYHEMFFSFFVHISKCQAATRASVQKRHSFKLDIS